MTQSDIISILEEEMSNSSSKLDELSGYDNASIEDVVIWYTETEKLLRVTANLTLKQAEHQVINQLRYAGHHILKAFTLEKTDPLYKDNTFEAYKHCLRAYYDVLDGFCLTFSDIIQNKVIYIEDKEERDALTQKIMTIIKDITEARFNENSRAKYYKYIVSQLIVGLNLLNEVIEKLSNDSLYRPKQELIEINQTLTERNRQLEVNIKSLKQKLDSKFNKFSTYLAISISIATLIGILFQGVFTNFFITNNHKIQILSQEKHTRNTPPLAQNTIKITTEQTQRTNKLEKNIPTPIKKEQNTSE